MPSTNEAVRAHLMHLVPYSEASANPNGGVDLKQASSVRAVADHRPFEQTCGVQMAVLSPLEASSLWCKVEILREDETVEHFRGSRSVFREIKELNTDNSSQTRYTDVDVWGFDQELLFSPAVSGLYRIRLFVGESRDSFNDCHGEAFMYIEAPKIGACGLLFDAESDVIDSLTGKSDLRRKMFQVKFHGGKIDGQETFVAGIAEYFLVPHVDPRDQGVIAEAVRSGRRAVGWQHATSGSIYSLQSSEFGPNISSAKYAFQRDMTEIELDRLRKGTAT